MSNFTSGAEDSRYVKVPVETICVNTAPEFDLYMRNRNGRYVLYLAKNSQVLRTELERFLQKGHRSLYIVKDQCRSYQTYLTDNLDLILEDPSVSQDRKAEIVYNTASSLMQEVLSSPDDEQNLQRATRVAKNTVGLISNAGSVENVLAMTAFDYSTHTHSVNVCVYGLAVARFVGFTDPTALQQLSTGLLLHDVGKSKVDQSILNKPDRLTAEEFTHIKEHASLGAAALKEKNDLPSLVAQIAEQHHERIDGTGYPHGLAGDSLHEFSRLTAVIDVFDALTTRRPYKKPMSSFDALRIMQNDEGHLDKEMLSSLVRMLASGTTLT